MDVMFVTIMANDPRRKPTNCKLPLTNTFFSTRKGGTLYAHNGTSPNDRKRIDYTLSRQAHQPRVQDDNVIPQSSAPAKADSNHNILYITVHLSGHFAPNRQIRRPTKRPEFNRHMFMLGGKCRERVVARVISSLNQLLQPRNTSGMVEVFTTAILDAVENEVPSPPRRHRRHGWCESAEPLAARIVAWTAREDACQRLRAHLRDQRGKH